VEIIEKHLVRHHFNMEMDEYVKRRRGRGKRPLIRIGHKDEIVVHRRPGEKKGMLHKLLKKDLQPIQEDVPEEHVKMVLANQPLPEDAAGVQEEREDGFFARLRDRLFGEQEPAEEQATIDIHPPKQEEEPLVYPEVIEVLKISGKWLNKLEPETKQEFKNSSDYGKYKFFVDKINSRKK
jgi:hypothetical protein